MTPSLDQTLPSEFQGKVALVTGSASGIGQTITENLVRLGAIVVAIDIDSESLKLLKQKLLADGQPAGRFIEECVDICNENAVKSLIARVEEQVGPIAYLVNSAGVLLAGALTDSSASSALALSLRCNVQGVHAMSSAVARAMKPRKQGSIVTISSNAGAVPRINMGAYCASKAASTMLTQCLALELARENIRCNIVSPGSTDTPMLRSFLGSSEVDGVIEGDPANYKMRIPLGRVAEGQDITNATLFLLSEAARHITGHDLRVDGGASIGT